MKLMTQRHKIVQDIIRQRKTRKVLADPMNPVNWTDQQLAAGDDLVQQAIRDCGWAPFHYDRKQDGLAEPWRAYWMDCSSCRRMATSVREVVPNLKPGAKLPALLAGCGSLTLFTWLPQSPGDGADSAKLQRVNREHLAATAAAVQNFLLLLTAHDLPNYWSSGTLIADHYFDKLGIPASQQLAAAVFVHYPQAAGDFEMVGGKQRDNRSTDCRWLKKISWA
ncbi:MAG: hypothetical protein ACR2NP_08190 [Pirellulaceae bacterium]